MSFNIHFINFEENDFVSQNAKNKMKEFIKENISNGDFTQFKYFKDQIINQFINHSGNHHISLSCEFDDNNLKIIIEKITNEMNISYFKTKKILGNDTPTPQEIMKDKDKYVNEVFQNLLNFTMKCSSLNEVFSLLDTDYFNYIQLVCDFNYKDYLDQFFKKVNDLTDKSSQIPHLIKQHNTIYVDIKDIDKKTINSLNDSEDVDEYDIHSDDI